MLHPLRTFLKGINQSKSTNEIKKLLAVEMYKVQYGILHNVLGDFVSRRDISYNLRNAANFMREKVNTTY